MLGPPRLLAHRGVLTAVVGSVLLATTLLAAGPVLATAVAEAGLRAELDGARGEQFAVQVAASTTPSRARVATGTVVAGIERGLGDLVAAPDVVVSGGSVALAGQPADVVAPVVSVTAPGLLRDVEAARASVPPGAVPARLHVAAAQRLGVVPGDVLRTGDGVELVLVATVAPEVPEDQRWWGQQLLRDGVLQGTDFVQVGPLLVEDAAAVAAVEGSRTVTVRVRTLPVVERLRPDDLAGLGRSVGRLGPRLQDALEGVATQVRVTGGLGTATGDAAAALTATRAAAVAATLQVAVLALYALGLAGRLLRTGRTVETELVRARGATPWQLGGVAALEALLVVVPAVALAPLLATGVTALLGRLPFAVGAGLALRPRPVPAAWVAAVLAGVACVAVLTLPVVAGARATYASLRAGTGRRPVAQVAQRLGLDLALVAVAVVGVWQLRRAGGPVAGVAGGGVGVDPVLVLTPGLGLLAGGLLVLRVVPLLARAGDVVAARARTLVAGLGGWQLARRPDAFARPTLLLVLAVAVGVLAGTYGATWYRSQSDQAAAAVGVDVAFAPDRRPAGLPPAEVRGALRELDGVAAASATWEGPVRFAGGRRTGTLVALDAGESPLRFPAGTAPSVPLAALDVPAVDGLELGPGQLAVTGELAGDRLWPDAAVQVRPVVRDADGALHRLPRRDLVRGATVQVAWDLAALATPLRLVAWEVDAATAERRVLLAREQDGDLGPAAPRGPDVGLVLRDPTLDGVSLDPGAVAWQADPVAPTGLPPATLDAGALRDDGWVLRGSAGATDPPSTVRLRLVAVQGERLGVVPALAHPDVLAATGAAPGDRLGLVSGGVPLDVEVVGTLDVLPGRLDTPRPVLVDLDAVTRARWEGDRATTVPTGWQVVLDVPADADAATRLGAAREVAAGLRASPVAAPQVRTFDEDRAARRADPIAVGLLLALALGAVTALLLAVLGTVSTAAAGLRERAGELALLQAVGTSVGQLRRALAGEVALVVGAGAVAGAGLGAALVWAVLPTIALAADGTPAVPAPVVEVPWLALLGGLLAVVLALLPVPVLLARVVARQHVAEVLRLGEDAG